MKHHTDTDKSVNIKSDLLKMVWDVIIIGAGMGGGTAAYQLTRYGINVLLIEKGLSSFKQFHGVQIQQERPQERLESGKWSTKLSSTINGNDADFWAPLGCGIGGSSLLYGAALQRLQPEDFNQQQLPNGQHTQWPFSYKDLEPYYQQAEQLFSVRGTPDPLDKQSYYDLQPPPVMCGADQHFFQQFQKAGLHPYHLHVGIKYTDSCGECSGHICPKACKQDVNNACIRPSLASGNLTILDQSEVLRLHANQKSIDSVEIISNGKQETIRGKYFILAAGAYFSPIILQKSANKYWPDGVANQSGLVGKNLMLHASDFMAFWPKTKLSANAYNGANKSIGVRDFYRSNNQKFGEFQSTGHIANYGHILYALRLRFDHNPFLKIPVVGNLLRSFIRNSLRLPAFIASQLFGGATVFVTIVEDYPYEDNCVRLDTNTPSGMRIHYSIRNELRDRAMLMKQKIRSKLSHLRSLPLDQGVNLNFGHPCGTCKAGNDPFTSVVDQNCKAHGIDNLYIADSSFMPTSGGTNPSLTVAANALRVADRVAVVLQKALKVA